MTTYATSKPQTTNGLADARLYWRISGPVLLLTALLGFLLNAINQGTLLGTHFLAFDFAHNGVHLLLAAVGLYLGFGAADMGIVKGVAKAFGVVYLGLAVVGFITPNVFGIGDLLGLHLELGENLVHLVLGAWGVYAGFAE